ncbi:hypothetical protein HanPI659440_Chr10g0389651 [Helianthus annuus]|nr:hypothetical protein HanPI659440_Chr10g0389651 [Helianthus annuus]
MPISTYPKEWKNRFIFVSPSMISESLPLWDPAAVIEDGVPPLSVTKDMLWWKMYEHPTRAFNSRGILAMGGLSPFYPIHPKAFCERKEMTLWSLLQAGCKGVSYVVEGVVNQEMGGVLGGNTPDVGGFNAGLVLGEGTPYPEGGGGSPKGSEGSHNSPPVEDVSNGDEDLATRLSQKNKPN